jgi:hypothetical protein
MIETENLEDTATNLRVIRQLCDRLSGECQ